MRFTDWLFARVKRTDSIALSRLMQLLFEFLTREHGLEPATVAAALWRDYRRGGRTDKPAFLAQHLPVEEPRAPAVRRAGPRRQSRHAAA